MSELYDDAEPSPRGPTFAIAMAIVGGLALLAAVPVVIALARRPAESHRIAQGTSGGAKADRGPVRATPAVQGPVEEPDGQPLPPFIPPAPQPKAAVAQKPAPKDDVPADPPGVQALLNHPWWRGTIRRDRLASLLQLLTSHGEGTVFFDKQGNAAWLNNTECRVRGTHDGALLMCYSAAALVGQRELAQLGEPRKLVPIRAGLGARMSGETAAALLQDFLNMKDSAQLRRDNEKIWNDLFNQKGF